VFPRPTKQIVPFFDPQFFSHIRLVALRFGAALAILAGFWLAAAILSRIICRFGSRVPGNRDLYEFLGRTARMSLIVFGFVTALGTAGVNVSALVAGLGLTGFALGFAFRDILSNMLAGILLLLYRPFARGDHITVAGLDGSVVHIDLRYTVLSAQDKTILLPNSNLFTNPIIVARPADQHPRTDVTAATTPGQTAPNRIP
jgi:small conductance mechanosensitive channel